jgi:transcriptional regulator with XRE-family HTH domain
MLLRRSIGNALRAARARQGLTLRDVAALARVSVAYLSEVERGRKEVSSEVLAAICAALGLRLVDLLDEVRDELAHVEPVGVGTRAPAGGIVRPAGRGGVVVGTRARLVAVGGATAPEPGREVAQVPAGAGVVPTWDAVATTWSTNPYSRAS